MTNTKVKIEHIPVVNFRDTLKALQEDEWNKLPENPSNESGSSTLPDGREDIFGRLWDEIRNHKHGNQKFTNDSYFIYAFPSFNGEPLTKVQTTLYEYCKDAIVNETLVFDVSW